jgi:hypothetical protein
MVPKSRISKTTKASYLKIISSNETEIKKLPAQLEILKSLGTGDEYVIEVNKVVSKMNEINAGIQKMSKVLLK